LAQGSIEPGLLQAVFCTLQNLVWPATEGMGLGQDMFGDSIV